MYLVQVNCKHAQYTHSVCIHISRLQCTLVCSLLNCLKHVPCCLVGMYIASRFSLCVSPPSLSGAHRVQVSDGVSVYTG